MGKKITIDSEFKKFMNALDPAEYAALEKSIAEENCRHALIVWKGILVDGHNRYEICKKLGKAFKTVELIKCNTREEVMLWMIDNQMARRNLSDLQRIELARRHAGIIAELARKNLKTSTGGANPRPLENSTKAAINTREIVAAKAGVSTNAVAKAQVIEEHGIAAIQNAARQKALSINAAEKLAKLPAEQQVEIAAGGVEVMRKAAKALSGQKGNGERKGAARTIPAATEADEAALANPKPGNEALLAELLRVKDELNRQIEEVRRLQALLDVLTVENHKLKEEKEQGYGVFMTLEAFGTTNQTLSSQQPLVACA